MCFKSVLILILMRELEVVL